MKYGMRYTTVRYWQQAGATLWHQNGVVYGLVRLALDPQQLWLGARTVYGTDARTFAHILIALAQVVTPDELRRLLDGRTITRPFVERSKTV